MLEVNKDKLLSAEDILKSLQLFEEKFNPDYRLKLMENQIKYCLVKSDCNLAEEVLEDYLKKNTLLKPFKDVQVLVRQAPEQKDKKEMSIYFMALNNYMVNQIGKMNNEM